MFGIYIYVYVIDNVVSVEYIIYICNMHVFIPFSA